MQYRTVGRTGWQISEVGYGMWQVGGHWGGSDDEDALRSLERSVELGGNFFDSAWGQRRGFAPGIRCRVINLKQSRRPPHKSGHPVQPRQFPSEVWAWLRSGSRCPPAVHQAQPCYKWSASQ